MKNFILQEQEKDKKKKARSPASRIGRKPKAPKTTKPTPVPVPVEKPKVAPTSLEDIIDKIIPGDKFNFKIKKGDSALDKNIGIVYLGQAVFLKDKTYDADALPNDKFVISHEKISLGIATLNSPSEISKKDFLKYLSSEEGDICEDLLYCDESYIRTENGDITTFEEVRQTGEIPRIPQAPAVEPEPTKPEVAAPEPEPEVEVEPEPAKIVIKKLNEYVIEDIAAIEAEGRGDILAKIYNNSFGVDGDIAAAGGLLKINRDVFYLIRYLFGFNVFGGDTSEESRYRADVEAAMAADEERADAWFEMDGKYDINNYFPNTYDDNLESGRGIPLPDKSLIPEWLTQDKYRSLQYRTIPLGELIINPDTPISDDIINMLNPASYEKPVEKIVELPAIKVSKENDFRMHIGEDDMGCNGPCTPDLLIRWQDYDKNNIPDNPGGGELSYGRSDPLGRRKEVKYPLNSTIKKFFGKQGITNFAQYWQANINDINKPIIIRRKDGKLTKRKVKKFDKGDVMVSGPNFWPIHVGFSYEEFVKNSNIPEMGDYEMVLLQDDRASLTNAQGVASLFDIDIIYDQKTITDIPNIIKTLEKRLAYFGISQNSDIGPKSFDELSGILEHGQYNPFGGLDGSSEKGGIRAVMAAREASIGKLWPGVDGVVKDVSGSPLFMNIDPGGKIDNISTIKKYPECKGEGKVSGCTIPLRINLSRLGGRTQMFYASSAFTWPLVNQEGKEFKLNLGRAYCLPKDVWRGKSPKFFTAAEEILAQRLGIRLDQEYSVDFKSGKSNLQGIPTYVDDKSINFSRGGLSDVEYIEAAKPAASSAPGAVEIPSPVEAPTIADPEPVIVAPDPKEVVVERKHALIFGSSQGGPEKIGGALKESLLRKGFKEENIVEKIFNGNADDFKKNPKKSLLNKLKKGKVPKLDYSHAFLFLGGNTAPGKKYKAESPMKTGYPDYYTAKEEIINYMIVTLKIPKENIVVILPPINTNLETKNARYSNSRRAMSEKAKNFLEDMGVKVAPLIIGGKSFFRSDGLHANGESDDIISVTDNITKDMLGEDAPPPEEEPVENLVPGKRDTSHVKIAMEEYAKWRNGTLKDENPESWKYLAEYWGNISHSDKTAALWPALASSGLMDYYFARKASSRRNKEGYTQDGWISKKHNQLKKGGQKFVKEIMTEKGLKEFYQAQTKRWGLEELPYGSLEKYIQDFKGKIIYDMPYNPYWSAAFIQYCFKDQPEFKKLAYDAGLSPSRLKGHKGYWGPAQKNTKKLRKTKNINSVTWIYLTPKEVKSIGYKEEIGDVVFKTTIDSTRSKIHHGDILTAVGRIGGNKKRTVGREPDSTKIAGIFTNSPKAKELFLFYLLPKKEKIEFKIKELYKEAVVLQRKLDEKGINIWSPDDVYYDDPYEALKDLTTLGSGYAADVKSRQEAVDQLEGFIEEAGDYLSGRAVIVPISKKEIKEEISVNNILNLIEEVMDNNI